MWVLALELQSVDWLGKLHTFLSNQCYEIYSTAMGISLLIHNLCVFCSSSSSINKSIAPGLVCENLQSSFLQVKNHNLNWYCLPAERSNITEVQLEASLQLVSQ